MRYGFTEWLGDPNRDWDGNGFRERFIVTFFLVKAELNRDVADHIFDIKKLAETMDEMEMYENMCQICDLGYPPEGGAQCNCGEYIA